MLSPPEARKERLGRGMRKVRRARRNVATNGPLATRRDPRRGPALHCSMPSGPVPPASLPGPPDRKGWRRYCTVTLAVRVSPPKPGSVSTTVITQLVSAAGAVNDNG